MALNKIKWIMNF